MRRGDGVNGRRIDPRSDRVLLRHGYYRSELERSGVLPPEAGDQRFLGLPPSNSWSNAMRASACPFRIVLNQLSPEVRARG